MIQPATRAATAFLERPEGRIAYDLAGRGPLVVCVPGMGDTRAIYRGLAPSLVAAGYRVATMDLRGHGESDTSFRAHDDVAAGTDALALVGHLGGGRAVLIGNSMGAGAVTWAAAEAPDRVAALVLIGPFVRNIPVALPARVALRLALLRPWGPNIWNSHYARLYPGRRPEDLDSHRAEIRRSLARPGGWRAFVATTRTSHAPVEARLGEVSAPTLVVMGERDPDFPDPEREAQLIAGRLRAEVVMVPGAGHYPQSQAADTVSAAVIDFLARTVSHA